MTARCHGATSSAKAGLGATVYIGPAAIGALFNNAPTAWAVPIAGFIGAVTYELATFCTADPPAVPTFSASDIEAILNPMDLIPFGQAVNKFRDLIGALTWDDLCKCDDGSAPITVTGPSVPTGAPTINPPGVGPSYPTGTACYTVDYDIHVTPPNSDDQPLTVIPFPVGVTSVTCTVTPSRHMDSADGTGYQLNLNAFNSSTSFLGQITTVGESSTGSTLTNTGTPPAGTTQWRVLTSILNVAADVELNVHVEMFCGGGTTGGPTPTPCPTDPFTAAILEQILALVTTIQRQKAPFAYVASSAHSGLTGSGHLDVQGLLGCKVQLDSYGSAVGVESGDPAEFFDAGWIVWENADGGTAREHITHSPFVSLPDLAGQFTHIGYTLGQGVSATITELVREP